MGTPHPERKTCKRVLNCFFIGNVFDKSTPVQQRGSALFAASVLQKRPAHHGLPLPAMEEKGCVLSRSTAMEEKGCVLSRSTMADSPLCPDFAVFTKINHINSSHRRFPKSSCCSIISS